MANIGLLDLPVPVLLIILLFLEAEDPTYADVLAFCFTHPQMYQFLTGEPHLKLTFPRPVSDSFFKLHNVFINRSLHIFNGLQHKRFYHFHPVFQVWFDELEASVGRQGIAEMVFHVLRLDVIELLCGDSPPTLEQWTALAQEETGNFFACYILLLEYDNAIWIYCGSATDQTKGFLARLSTYMNLNYTNMPQLITKLISQEKEFRILLVLPILRILPDEKEDIVFGDMRVLVFLIETMMMVWNRALLPDTKWENLMAYSPWTRDMTPFVRTNRALSTKLEWPYGLLKSEEAIAAAKEHTKAQQKAKQKAYDAKPENKARKAVYNARPEKKAQRKAHAAKPETKARKAAYDAKPERKAYAAKPENKARKAAYDAKPERKAQRKL